MQPHTRSLAGQPGAMAQTYGARVGGGRFSGEGLQNHGRSHILTSTLNCLRETRKNQSGYILFDNVKTEVKEKTLMMKILWNLSFSLLN